jgi:hypothetical protein
MPMNVFNIPRGFVYLRRLKHWGNLAPHLFRPVKTIYAGRSIPHRYLNLTDLLFGNDFQKRSSKVSVADIPGLGSRLKVQPEGWMFQDYKVNISRLKIELLKEIHLRGGIVLNHTDISNNDGKSEIIDNLNGVKRFVKCSSIKFSSDDSRKIFYSGGLPWPDFSIRINSGKYNLLLYDYNGKMAITTEPEAGFEMLQSLISTVWIGEIPDLKEVGKTSGEEKYLKMTMPRLLRDYKLDCAPGGIEKRPVEELMETAFDIAKQTGIGFQEFRTLFYRYGKGIDWMTEKAYEWMIKERDAKIIWSRAEADYAAVFEWGKDSRNP